MAGRPRLTLFLTPLTGRRTTGDDVDVLPADLVGLFDVYETVVNTVANTFVQLVQPDSSRVVLIVTSVNAILQLTISTDANSAVGAGLPVGPESHLTSVLHGPLPSLEWYVGCAANGQVSVFQVCRRRTLSLPADNPNLEAVLGGMQ